MEFCKAFNARTTGQLGTIIPVVISIYIDRSFSFVTKTPPAPVLILKAAGLEKASPNSLREKVGTITRENVRRIAETKKPDLNCSSLESAMRMIAGTARSMGIEVVD